jgi:hypothetical protein
MFAGLCCGIGLQVQWYLQRANAWYNTASTCCLVGHSLRWSELVLSSGPDGGLLYGQTYTRF